MKQPRMFFSVWPGWLPDSSQPAQPGWVTPLQALPGWDSLRSHYSQLLGLSKGTYYLQLCALLAAPLVLVHALRKGVIILILWRR